ncbi:MAG: GDP-mannose 4,6-dehydratase [Sedimentisphaerales bacterium]|nr:GDP-mannose 4,6-dehydratase [Sedimentisphaerales bacterium]
MNVLITGVAGFIGSHLSERLLADGHNVTGVDNFDAFYDPRIKRKNISGCFDNEHFQMIEADIREADAMDKAVSERTELIVHLAAKAGVRPSIDEPLLCADVNVNGTVVLLEAAVKHNVKKFIFASSSSVYGNNKKVPFSETDNVDFPISPYATSKKAGELMCHTYHHLYGIDITALRFFTVYGPRQRPDLAIHKFVSLIEQGKAVPVYGDGTMMRDFTYIDDIIDGVVSAIDKCGGFNIFNLGESRPITVNDLVSKLEKSLGKKAVKDFQPIQPGDVERTYADVARAVEQLGYKPRTTIEAGLAKFVDWFRRDIQTNA